jgi:hypothetical protein
MWTFFNIIYFKILFDSLTMQENLNKNVRKKHWFEESELEKSILHS